MRNKWFMIFMTICAFIFLIDVPDARTDIWHVLRTVTGDVSSDATNMTPFDANGFDKIEVQAVVTNTGSPAVTAISADLIPVFLQTNITNVAYSALIHAGGSTQTITGSAPFIAEGNCWFWVSVPRVAYTAASTTAVLTISVRGK